MKLRVFPAILLAAAAACAPSAPPADSPNTASMDADVPPVLALLSEKESLALEPSQVVALESIARSWEAKNDTLTHMVGARKGRGPNPLRVILGKHARQSLAAMAENNRRAAMAVAQVLQPEQRETLCAAQRLQREVAAVARNVKGTAQGRRREEGRRAWPWCASTRSQQTEARSASR